jgi:hypothetical protein
MEWKMGQANYAISSNFPRSAASSVVKPGIPGTNICPDKPAIPLHVSQAEPFLVAFPNFGRTQPHATA